MMSELPHSKIFKGDMSPFEGDIFSKKRDILLKRGTFFFIADLASVSHDQDFELNLFFSS